MSTANRPRVHELHIRSVRGIVELDLKLGAKGLVLQGANGLGKSSVADALELLLLGGISHLDGTKGLSLAKHGKHVRARDEDVHVSLLLNDGGTVARKLTGAASLHGSGQAYHDDAQRKTFLLRRSQLLGFIHADPADRFRELAALIGISQLDGLELALKRSADALAGAFNADVEATRAGEIELKALTGTDTIVDDAAALAFVNARLTALQRPEVASLELAADVAAALVDPAAVSRRTRDLVAAEEAQAAGAALLQEAQVLTRVDVFVAGLQAFRDRSDARQLMALSSIIAEAQRYFDGHETSVCPVCEQPIDRDGVRQQLAARQQQLQELTDEASALRMNAATLRGELDTARGAGSLLLDKHGAFFDDTSRDQVRGVLSACVSAIAQLAGKDLLGSGELPTDLTGQHAVLSAAMTTLAGRLAAHIESLKPSNQEKASADAMQQILRLQALLTNRARLLIKVQRGLVLTQRAKTVLAELVGAKNDVVVDIYAAIKGDVDAFYASLHPGEPHGNIVLDVSKRASTTLLMDSFGVPQQDPRAFSSEGHLDSLGLCIFLAFANTFRGQCGLLVLDDVIMSIDSGHRKRIAEFLIDQFDDFQLIVTTHDRIWFQELADAQRAFGRQGDFMNLQIVDWTVEGGPVLSNFTPTWDRVAEKVAAGDLPGAGGDIRRNLEWILQEIAERVQAPVPFQRATRYTVDILYQPVKQRLLKLYAPAATPAITAIESTKLFANMLSHATADTDAVAKEEVQEFSSAVQGLFRSFCCANCGALLHYDQVGKTILCRNPKCSKKTLHNCG